MRKHFLKYSCVMIFTIIVISCSQESPNEPEESPNKPEESPNEFYVNTVVITVSESVNQDSLLNSMEILSGEKSFNISGLTKRILGRHSNYSGNEIAADFIESKFKSYGLQVENHQYSANGRNVIGKLIGTTNSTEYYIICAHYDSMPEDSIAPGADDNASGTSAVIEAARLLSKLKPNYSIIFALWDEEEQGLIGSRNWVAQAAANSMKIKGVFNLDMIGWNSDNVDAITVGIVSLGYTDLTKTLTGINSKFNLGLIINIQQKGGSDHVSFWEKNYNAIRIMEDINDVNKLIHESTDRVSSINISYFKRIARLAISSLAKMAFI